MYVNIIGHVKSPGTYLIYEGADILTILSQAGGPLPGAKLKETILYRKKSELIVINLNEFFNTGDELDVVIKPNDTIYIKETTASYLFSKSNLINLFLSVLNIYLVITTN